MADTKTKTADADGAATNPPAVAGTGAGGAGGAQGGENLEKVRDILFGSQMRDQERRFTRLEEKVARDMAEVREESRKRLDALEGYVKKEVQSLLDRIKAEQGQRAEAVKSVGQELKETAKAMEVRAGENAEQATRIQRELREELLGQSKALRDEIYQGQQQTGSALDRSVKELRGDKADRAALAALFTDMAVRLTGDDGSDRK